MHREARPRAIHNAFHRISLFRHLLEWAGGERDVRQHRLDLTHSTNYNANIFGSLVGINGPQLFGSSYSQAMLGVVSKSKVFADRSLDVVKLSTELMVHLPIGFPDDDLVCSPA